MVFFSTVLRCAVTASVVSALLTPDLFPGQTARAETLNGAGASYPAPLYQLYAAEIKEDFPGLTINYLSVGSSSGIRQFMNGTVDFGASDAAMKDAEIAKVDRGVILVPTAGGAVAIPYNLPGIAQLQLSREVLSAIFSGQITRWNHPQIGADNPDIDLPNQEIQPVVRADSSGTTFIFTRYLSMANADFNRRIGANQQPRWPGTPIQGQSNSEVAALVRQTPGSIGYVEYSYAKAYNLQTAFVENRSGEFVAPSLETANQAIAALEFPDNFRVFASDPTQGYPIVALTWLLIHRQYPSAAKANAVQQMIAWVMTEGQKLNAQLDYTRIPESVAQRILQTVQSKVQTPEE